MSSPSQSNSSTTASSPDSSRSLNITSTPPTTSSKPSNRSIHAPPPRSSSSSTPPSSHNQELKISTTPHDLKRTVSNSSLLSALCGDSKSPTSPTSARSSRDPSTGRRLPSWYSIHAPEGFRPTPPTNPYKLNSNRLLSNAMDGLKAQSEKSTSLSPSCDPTPLNNTSSVGLARRASTGSEFGQRREVEGVSSISARSLNEESAFEDPELRNTFRSDMEEGPIATINDEGGRSNTLGLNLGSVSSSPSSSSNISQSPTNMQIDSSTPGLPEAIQDIRELEAEKEELELKLVNLQEGFKVKERELLQDLEGERKVTKEVELERDGLKDKIKELEQKLGMAKPFDSTLDKVGQEPKVAMLEKQVIELTKKLSRRPENIKHSLVGGKGNYSRSEMLEMQGSKLAKLSEKNVERDQVLPREINASEACKEMRIRLDHYERNDSQSGRTRGATNRNSPNSISNPRPLSTLNPNFGTGPSFVELENLKRANSKLQQELQESHHTVEELMRELDSGFHDAPASPESSRQSSIHVIDEEEEEEL
ncbi:hypothetical protein JCM5353_007006 [Sporobolomyces roseus]